MFRVSEHLIKNDCQQLVVVSDLLDLDHISGQVIVDLRPGMWICKPHPSIALNFSRVSDQRDEETSYSPSAILSHNSNIKLTIPRPSGDERLNPLRRLCTHVWATNEDWLSNQLHCNSKTIQKRYFREQNAISMKRLIESLNEWMDEWKRNESIGNYKISQFQWLWLNFSDNLLNILIRKLFCKLKWLSNVI